MSVDGGNIVSEWSSSAMTTESARDDGHSEGERPKKKQKTAPQAKPANIIKLAVSPNQQYAVTVTDD
ncbi:hypothetical protein LTR53_019223, partial [Teratosphaeriaceae sp. CCFEE 6253]